MEANTDRLWWTVGIVIIGGILISSAVILFPEIMNQVGNFFKNQLEIAQTQIAK